MNTKLVNGERVDLTVDEETQRAASEAAWAAGETARALQSKIDEVHAFVGKKTAALADPLDSLRMTVITGLQGDRARGKPLAADRQAILDAAEADARKALAEDLLIAADDILSTITATTDVPQAFIDRGVS